MSFRTGMKRAVEAALRHTLVARRLRSPRRVVLAYHNVVPDRWAGRGDRSLHLPIGDFRRQLDVLESLGGILPLADLIGGPGREPGLRVAVTFDDAYAGTLSEAGPELRRRGLPSTLFVPPGLLGGQTLWWDELAASGSGMDEARRGEALTRLQGRASAIRSAFRPGRVDLPECFRTATERDVLAAASPGGMVLGAHSWGHPNLAAISLAELAEELERPLAWLGAVPAASVPFVAYPYGLASEAVERASRDAGYRAGFLVAGGGLPDDPSTSPFSLPRLNVPAGLSLDGFLLRVSGVLGG